MKPSAKNYFENRAATYHDDSVSWPWSWLRNREAAAFLELLGDIRGQEVLELGCGAGFYTRLLAENGARLITAVDLSPGMIALLASGNVRGVTGNAAKIDLGRKFERVVSLGLLEFVESPEAVLTNARRHCEDHGVMVVLAPLSNVWGYLYKLYHMSHGVKISLFSPRGLVNLAKKSGWEVTSKKRVPPFTIELRMQPLL